MRASLPLPSLLLAGRALGGPLASLLLVGGPAVESTAVGGAAERQPVLIGPVCHGAASGGLLRLAQTRTEVPKAEMQAVMPAAAFADTEPPLWDGLGAVTYKVTTASVPAQAYFDQGLRL